MTITTTGGDVLIWFSGIASINAVDDILLTLLADGVDVSGGAAGLMRLDTRLSNKLENASFAWRIAAPSAASHTYKVQWKVGVGSNTATLKGNPNATLIVQELPS